jgi:hypothetical protein
MFDSTDISSQVEFSYFFQRKFLWSLFYLLNMEDTEQLLHNNLEQFVSLVRTSKNIVVYTGAGVSTAANVPDFRGENGLNKKGILGLKEHELDQIMPTYTHQAIKRYEINSSLLNS